MSWRQGIHGYAARWGVETQPLRRPNAPHLSRPARFTKGCFIYDPAHVAVWFMHNGHQCFGTGPVIGLDVWDDDYGLAFAFTPPPTAYSLVCGIAEGRYAQCSVGFGLTAGRLEPMRGGTGDVVTSAVLTEISIVPFGACPGTACWHSANVAGGLPSHATALAPRWAQGRARAQLARLSGGRAVAA